MAVLGLLDKSMLIHHNICVIGMLQGCYTKHSADVLIAALFVSEISNPAMHIRVVLKHLQLRYSKSYEMAELTYICKIYLYIIFTSILYVWSCWSRFTYFVPYLGMPFKSHHSQNTGSWTCQLVSLFHLDYDLYIESQIFRICREKKKKYKDEMVSYSYLRSNCLNRFL